MIAQAKLKPRGAGLHFSVQDATSLPYADETFDAVLIANACTLCPGRKRLWQKFTGFSSPAAAVCPNLCAWRGTPHPLRMLAMRCAGLANL